MVSNRHRLLLPGRHDPKLIKNHPLQPDPAMLKRVMEDQNKEYKEITDKSGKDQSRGENKDQPKKSKGNSSRKPGGRSRYYKGKDLDNYRDYGYKWGNKRSRDDKDSEKDERRPPRNKGKADQSHSKTRMKDADLEKE